MLSGSGCARQTVFERRHDFYEHPTRRYWSYRGTHAHTIIERAGPLVEPYGWLQELSLKTTLTYPDEPRPIFDDQGAFTGRVDKKYPLVIEVGGTTDAYRPVVAPYPLWDFKSMADAKALMFIRGEKGGTFTPHLDDRWVWQLNIYRWLVSRTKIPAALKKRFNLRGTHFPAPEFLGIQGISMMHIPRSGQQHRLKNEPKPYEIDDVPVLALEDIEEFVRGRALQWYRWLVLGDTPPVVPKDQDWLCKNCAFNGDLIDGEICHPSIERQQVQDTELELV